MISLDLHPIDVLRRCGVLSPRDPSKRTVLVFYVFRALLFLLTVTVTVSTCVQLFVAPELTQLARNIEVWTLLLSGLYKWCYLAAFSERFAELNAAIIVQTTKYCSDRSTAADRFMVNCLRRTRRMSRLYLFSGIVGLCLGIVNPLISYPKGNRTRFDYFNDPKTYPIICWIPFAINETWMYLVIFIGHSITALYMVLLHLSIDSFMFGSIYIIGGHIELLNSSLNNIINMYTENGNGKSFADFLIYIKAENKNKYKMSTCLSQFMQFTEKQQDECYRKLRECAIYHISILKCIQDVRKLFSTLIIVDYLHGVISLTFALFQLTISVSAGELISIFFFICLGVGHQFLNNYFGEYIIQKQSSIYSTVYNFPWTCTNTKVRRLLKLIILRSQKPQFIIGFYMYKLYNESFVAFIKTLYTYYMVLRHINSEQY